MPRTRDTTPVIDDGDGPIDPRDDDTNEEPQYGDTDPGPVLGADDDLDADPSFLDGFGKADTLDDVDERFQFSTEADVDEDDDTPPALTIAIDGQRIVLNAPSDAAMAWRMSQLMGASDEQTTILAMFGILEASIDGATMAYIRQRMLTRPRDPGKKFRADIIGELVELIVRRWGDEKMAQTVTTKRQGPTRAARRANGGNKGKRK